VAADGAHLMPYLTAKENIELPMTNRGRGAGTNGWARELFQIVGCGARQHHLGNCPAQQQRGGIAVALATGPSSAGTSRRARWITLRPDLLGCSGR